MEAGIIGTIAVIIILASILALVGRRLRQPVLVAYVAAGIIAGPHVLGLIGSAEEVGFLTEFGIVFLLFIIGLELDAKRIREVGAKVIALGILQVVITLALGLLVSLALGLSREASACVSMAAALSSTMVIAKLLKENRELESLHGSVVIGVLVVQDIIAAISLSALLVVGSANAAGMVFGKGIVLIAASLFIYKFFMPRFLKEISSSSELLFLGSLAVMFLFSLLSNFLGYSYAIGAFVGGMIIGTTYYSSGIASRFKPLEDFFLIIFFVVIGLQFSVKGADFSVALAIVLMAMLVKPVIIYFLSRLLKLSSRTSFMAAIKLGQGSEFAIIIASQALLAGHVSEGIVSAVILGSLVTMVLSTCIMRYDSRLYSIFIRLAGKASGEAPPTTPLSVEAIIFGINDISLKVAEQFIREGKLFIVVDYSPEKVRDLLRRGIPSIYGDMLDPELYDKLGLKKAGLVISTVQYPKANLVLIREVRKRNRKALIMATLRNEQDAAMIYEAGADFVVMPRLLGAEKIVNYLRHLDAKEIRKWGKRYYRQVKQQ
ncbi:MAG: cation:proton antiporter [Candidatus Woesearchaeota archaeon]